MRPFAQRELYPNDLFRLKYVHDARISPDGRSVAYVISRTVEETEDEYFEIAVENLASGTRQEIGFAGCATFPRWSPDGTRLAFIGIKEESSRLYIADAISGAVVALTPDSAHAKGQPAWSPDGSAIAYAVVGQRKSQGIRRITQRIFRAEGFGVADSLRMSLHVVDVSTRTERAIDVGVAVALQPAFSPCGTRILFLGADAALGDAALVGGLRLYTVGLSSADITEVLGEGWFIASAAWSPCGNRIVIAGDYKSQLIVPRARLWVVNLDGSNPECRTDESIGNIGFRIHHDMPSLQSSQDGILSVPHASEAYASVLRHGRTEICRIALAGPRSCEIVATGPRSCLVMDTNAESSQLLYCASDLNTPWELYLSDRTGKGEKRLTFLNDAVLAQWPKLNWLHLKFESDDGLPIEGWYLAREDRIEPQPTVMFIHGGPMLSTGHAFRFDFHLLAANGFAVLSANFRGSSGYGESFQRAIVGDYGARGFPDHMAAINAAVARGLSDATRLGVWGPSHGGFATAWIVGHTDRFRAAVVESAAINWSTMYYLGDAPDLWVLEFGGRPDEIPDVYRSRSPITYASRCRTPTLLLHGEDDLRCPVTEAEQFYRALHDAGCTTELVCVPNMNHMGDSNGPLSARLTQNEALLDWFERYL
jgi:dipeptidyl aminopeptidase/acylaminoacyl peptidase